MKIYCNQSKKNKAGYVDTQEVLGSLPITTQDRHGATWLQSQH